MSDTYWLTRRVTICGLGFIYLIAFLIFYNQGVALLGVHGLLPIHNFSDALAAQEGGNWRAFFLNPSLFQFATSDAAIQVVSILGLVLSLPLLAGYANFPILFILWFLQLSIVNSGQLFYGYGWETQLLEFTFLCFFLCPLWRLHLSDSRSPPKKIAVVFLRWMLLRLMLGAGLIKLRGDPCWRDLTCLMFHYETQPNPHPMSWFYHQMPSWFHMGGALFNHFVEVILPFGVFGPKWVRRICGMFMAIFQLILISSGNLSWLNWLTLLMTVPCFDDEWICFLFRRTARLRDNLLLNKVTVVTLWAFGITGAMLSVQPALNLFSSHQMMNASFNQLHLINTYGAFGSVGKERDEIVISGTDSEKPNDEAEWKEYEFKCKPGRVDRRPCLVTPYHYKMDWQIWFSAMQPHLTELWLARFAKRLLEGDQNALSLIAENPFPAHPPKWLRMDLYRYRFTRFGEKGWWKRERLGEYLRPVQLSELNRLD